MQENPVNKEGPKGVLSHVRKKWEKGKHSVQSANCLITLRHEKDNGQPGSFEYINGFIDGNAEVVRLVCIGITEASRQDYLNYGVPVLFLDPFKGSDQQQEILARTSRVRKHFGWG